MKLLILSQTEDAYSHNKWSVVNAMYITQDNYFEHWCAKMKEKAITRKSCCGVRVQCLDIDDQGVPTVVGHFQHLATPKKQVEINKAVAEAKRPTTDEIFAAFQQIPGLAVPPPPVQGGF